MRFMGSASRGTPFNKMSILPEVLDLQQGEPRFLQTIFRDLLGVVEPITDFGYPNEGGDPELLEILHKIFPNYSYIIVTNGATQALGAAIEHQAKMWGPNVFIRQQYFWSRFPKICERNGAFIINGASCLPNIDFSITTSPNNPDGIVEEDFADIWDGSYYNPFYPVYADCKPVDIGGSGCAIFSGSKMLGVSGYRVGWLCT